MTLTVLLRAGAKSKLHQKKLKPQNVKFLWKTWVAPNNRLTISDQKLKNFISGIREQNKRTTRPQKQQLEMDLVTRKKKTKLILKEVISSKLSKLLQDSI